MTNTVFKKTTVAVALVAAGVALGRLVVGQREFGAPLCQADASRLQPLDLTVQCRQL